MREGPRGLGVAIGLTVDDLEATLDQSRRGDCEVTAESADQPWSDRVFECFDPSGYLWEVSTSVSKPRDATQALEATAKAGSRTQAEPVQHRYGRPNKSGRHVDQQQNQPCGDRPKSH